MKAFIAWKPVGDTNVPSSRLRAFIPCEYLKQKNWNCGIFDKSISEKYTIVVFQKCYEEEDIQLAVSLKSKGIKIVFDLCDNHFYDGSGNEFLIKRKERLERMINIADQVTVSTPEIGMLIHNKKYTVIDDALYMPPVNPVIDGAYQTWNGFKNLLKRSLNICWFGSAGMTEPRFGMIDLVDIIPALENVHTKIPITLNIISSSKELFKKYIRTSFPSKYHVWQKSTFPYLLRTNDLCIIPINKNPFTMCKSNNRPILSLMNGVPVIADEIPSYQCLSDFILLGDWEKNILKYAKNKELRTLHVQKAQEAISLKYNKESVTLQWSNFFNNLLLL